MNFFSRSEITVRCAFRGSALAVPHIERLLNSCQDTDRKRLRRRLARIARDEQQWHLTWERQPGDRLVAHNRVALLRLRNIVVELLYAQSGVLQEIIAPAGERVRGGDRLATVAKLEKPQAPPPPETELDGDKEQLLADLIARRRRDAEQIKQLRIELSERLRQLGQLRGELALLRARQNAAEPEAGARRSTDRKFVRLKHEFSKRFHPDGRTTDIAELQLRTRVFQEFWPIVEEIERS